MPLIPVIGSPPSFLPHVEPAAGWVRFLAIGYPLVQIALGVCVIAFATIARAGFGRGLGNPDEGKKLWLLGVATLALLGLALSHKPAVMPEWALQQAQQQPEVSQRQAAAVERDRAALSSMFRTASSTIGPLTQGDLQRVNALTQPHHIFGGQS
jgi:hypothetical protein